ncbi:MAG: ABC transporter ATP-binding protein [Deltaproteobacteria bacterium]|nr:ABC transporter ATP-binding protein [Deltaproteobacteria bacterium]
MQEKGLRLTGIHQSYGQNYVIKGIDLSVREGEFLTLLGPSGSGKTTLLMIIAGFVTPSRGSVELNGKSILDLLPEERNFGLVFQGYALFPHLTVFENVAFPLKVRRVDENVIREKTRKALDMVQLFHFEDRLPKQLSGGQQQRVALARALVFEPALLLLDEPLGALDKKLREELQIELKILHKSLGSTFIYVTHDQEEALSMSDRIAVINDGRIEQLGPPEELYENPKSTFVANFLGESNLFEGTITDMGHGFARIELDGGGKSVVRANREFVIGDRLQFMVRPERIRTQHDEPQSGNRFHCRVLASNYYGDTSRYLIETEGKKRVKVRNETPYVRRFADGDRVWIWWDPDDCVLL